MVSTVSGTQRSAVARVVLVLVLVSTAALCGPLGAAASTQADVSGDDTLGGDSDGNTTDTGDSLTNTTDDTLNTTDDTLNTTDDTLNTTETVENTTETTQDTTDTDTVENTTDDTTGTVENSTDSTTDTVQDTTDTVENTTDDTADTVQNTTEETTRAVDDTVENTTDTVENTTDTVEETTDETTDTVEDTVENATVQNATETSDGNATAGTGSGSATTTTVTESEDTTESERAGDGSENTVDATTEDTDAATEPDRAVTTTTTANASAVAAGSDGDAGGSDIPSETGLVGGAVVAGAAGAALLSGGGGTVQTPGLVRAGAMQVRAAATAPRAWLAELGDRLWKIGAVLRYSRWDDSDPLEHDRRRAVYDAVEDAPGVYLSALEADFDGSLSSLRHHLRILEEEGLITTEKVRGKRRYFPVERDPVDPALAAAMDDPATEGVLTTLAERGPASGGDLAEALDRDPSTVSHHLSRLEDDGLVVREREGRAVVNRLSETAATALRDDALAGSDDRPAVADD